MPPKPKFTRQEVVETALSVVSKKGVEALTAYELRMALGTSASPIFTLFHSMAEIRDEVRTAAMRKFEEFSVDSAREMPKFKQIGMKMILFGMREPKLFQLLFMQENSETASFDDVFGELGETAGACIETLKRDYSLTYEQAKWLFENVWIYTFGIGVLCATRVCCFDERSVGELLTGEFSARMLLLEKERVIR